MSHLWIHCTCASVTLVTTLVLFPMSEEFIPNAEIYTAPPSAKPPGAEPGETCEPILITIIGSAKGLDLVIKILHRLGFAEARAWSKPQVDPNTGRPMRVLTKWLRY